MRLGGNTRLGNLKVMARDERSVTPQSEDFSAWYNDVVFRAELVDRGPVRGSMVIRPYGYRIWELLQADLDGRIKATGHQNAYFPLLIPQSYMQREAEHIEGFAPELFTVTHAGGKELEEPLVIRPTSETIVGEMMAKWISSHRDLPLLLNQWANVLRWELRPRMFLRTSEFLWQEGHTAHATAADATAETMLALGFYQDVAVQTAALATVPGEKTPGERFAGAERTFTLEAMMRDGRALQAGTSHFMGTNFAAAFGITYTSESGTAELCHTTSWGMTTRMIGALIMTHGDDKGLVLPPALAPCQVVIVPIGRGDQAQATLSAATELAATLRRAGIRTHVDDRPQASPGFKFNDWEMRGVPIRLELGPRDLAAGTALMSRRLSYRQPEGRTRPRRPSRSMRRPTCWLSSWPRSRRCWRGGPPTSATITPPRSIPGPSSSPPWRSAGRWRCTAATRLVKTRSRQKPRPLLAASRWRANPSRARASAAASRPPTASG